MLGLYRSAGPHSTSYADIDYRDRPEGSKTKLPAFSDGMTALRTIMPLLKDYRPMALFGWLTLIFVVVGLAFGIPVVAEFAATGLVPHLPTALLAVALVLLGMLSLVCGLVLDTVVKGTRKQYELQMIMAYEREQ